ncbi:MAG: diacylglycerol kinase family protein [Solirubrobacteraceae bacterium]
MTLSLIVNPFAGRGRAGRKLGEVEATLSGLGLEHHVEPTRSLSHARELARAAAAAGETAVAFGGDGLIGAVADGLRDDDGVLGILPGGRGNDFARMLGIPRDVASACSVLVGGRERRLDLGRVDATTFIGIASCGFDSVANRIANDTTFIAGNLVYVYGALGALLRWRPATFTIRLDDGAPRSVTGYTVVAANSRYYAGGMMMAPGAALEDGLLDVVIIADMPKATFARRLPSVFRGRHGRYPQVEMLRGAKLEIAASRPFTVYADGDPIAELPATIRVLPAAVRAIVPAPPATT